jgi:hypothetical protein
MLNSFAAKDQGMVLDRYARVSMDMCPVSFQRHACHVAAWVTHLSGHEATQKLGAEGLSAVLLLCQLLKPVSAQELVPRLKWLLKCVRRHVKQMLTSDKDNKVLEQWLQLQSTLQQLGGLSHGLALPIGQFFVQSDSSSMCSVLPLGVTPRDHPNLEESVHSQDAAGASTEADLQNVCTKAPQNSAVASLIPMHHRKHTFNEAADACVISSRGFDHC